jgi:multidrug resistance efflux pump
MVIRVSQKPKPPVAAPPPAPATAEISETTLPARIRAHTTVMVPAPIEGVLESLFVETNQEIYQGQLLGRTRNPQFEEAAQRAEAELDKAQVRVTNLGADLIAARLEASRTSAEQTRVRGEMDRLEKNYQRQQSMWREGITPRLTFEKAEKDYTAAKTELEQLDSAAKQAGGREALVARQLDEARRIVSEDTDALTAAKQQAAAGEMHSPVDGVVVARRGLPGERVDSSVNDLFVIATGLTSLEAIFTPDPPVLTRIHAGQQVFVRVPAVSADELVGVVSEVRGADVVAGFTSPVPMMKFDVAAQVRIKF